VSSKTPPKGKATRATVDDDGIRSEEIGAFIMAMYVGN